MNKDNIAVAEENLKANKLIVAVYSEDGKVLDIKMQPAMTTQQISIEADEDAKYAKVMLWDGFCNLKPETTAISLRDI